jgi:hypothetical protein
MFVVVDRVVERVALAVRKAATWRWGCLGYRTASPTLGGQLAGEPVLSAAIAFGSRRGGTTAVPVSQRPAQPDQHASQHFGGIRLGSFAGNF